MGNLSSGFETVGQLSAPYCHPACHFTGSPCVITAFLFYNHHVT